MKVAIYSRCSTDDKKQDVQNQLIECRAFATRQNWEIVYEFCDYETGKHSDREQFKKMFAAASRREFDVLLFWDLTRLSREGTTATLQHLQTLSNYGIGFRSYMEPFLDSLGPLKDAIIGLLAALSNMDRIRIVGRVNAGLRRYKQEYEAGRISPTGKSSKSGKCLAIGRPRRVLDKERVVMMRNQGKSWATIAQTLNIGVGTAFRAYQTFQNPSQDETGFSNETLSLS